MEDDIAVKIWNRSIDNNNMRYTTFVCDSDSKAFDKVCKSKPYRQSVDVKKHTVWDMSRNGWGKD